jgi:hypothetical protein
MAASAKDSLQTQQVVSQTKRPNNRKKQKFWTI